MTNGEYIRQNRKDIDWPIAKQAIEASFYTPEFEFDKPTNEFNMAVIDTMTIGTLIAEKLKKTDMNEIFDRIATECDAAIEEIRQQYEHIQRPFPNTPENQRKLKLALNTYVKMLLDCYIIGRITLYFEIEFETDMDSIGVKWENDFANNVTASMLLSARDGIRNTVKDMIEDPIQSIKSITKERYEAITAE